MDALLDSPTIAAAPFLIAESMNFAPSVLKPGMATKSAPGTARRESAVTLVTSTSRSARFSRTFTARSNSRSFIAPPRRGSARPGDRSAGLRPVTAAVFGPRHSRGADAEAGPGGERHRRARVEASQVRDFRSRGRSGLLRKRRQNRSAEVDRPRGDGGRDVEVAQRRFSDLFESGRGYGAAVFGAFRLVDDDQNRQSRTIGGNVAAERGEDFVAVAAASRFLRRPGLPGHDVLGQRGVRAGSARDDGLENFVQYGRGLFRDDAHRRGLRRNVNGVAFRVDDFLDDARLHADAAIGDGGDGGEDLQRRRSNLLTDRHRCIRKLRPLIGAAHASLRFARQRDAGALAETEAADVAVETVLPEREADTDRADVRRMHHHVFEGDETVAIVAVLVNLRVADLDESIAAVENLRGRDYALFQASGGGDDLECRSGLVLILDGAITAIVGREVADAVRIK